MSTNLQQMIDRAVDERGIALMTHWVIGYPSLEETYKVVEKMIAGGAEIIELQLPFSEPMADGHTISRASHIALENGATINDCFEFIADVKRRHPDICIIAMTYFNIVFMRGIDNFIRSLKEAGADGLIVPDLPPEEIEAEEYFSSCEQHKLHPILIFAPSCDDERLKFLGKVSSGLVYCVGRKGVTGQATHFNEDLAALLQRYRNATHLPIALGFGVQQPEHINFLKGKADIAVIGSRFISLYNESGADNIETVIKSLR
jgi:tryptophan synthase alpha chain